MPASDCSITIASVNWFSTEYLEKLFANLINKAAQPENLRFLIVDNTNGKDANLEKIKTQFANIEIISNAPGNLKGSPAHASGLNVIMQNIKTPYALILDPDVHIFKKNWDTFLLDLLERNQIFAAGTSYPVWQMGMYHNFPNPVFCFFKTEKYRQFCPGWSAYDVNKLTLYWDFFRRNFLRLGIFIGRKRFENSKMVQTIWPQIEKTFWRMQQRHRLAYRPKSKKRKNQNNPVSAENYPIKKIRPIRPIRRLSQIFRIILL